MTPELLAAARDLLVDDRRAVLGITGPPGAGKSTLASWLVAELLGGAAYLPMDGFHLADTQLARLGLDGRKGAPETFDVGGYVAALARVRRDDGPVYVPGFSRDLEQPIAAALVVPPSARLVVTEGNYLLHAQDGWELVRPLLDAVWYVDAPDDVRVERLLERHVRFGKQPGAARTWVEQVDEANARLIGSTRDLADLVVRLG